MHVNVCYSLHYSLTNTSLVTITQGGRVLFIMNVSQSDGGLYHCIATSQAGIDLSNSARITVIGKFVHVNVQ